MDNSDGTPDPYAWLYVGIDPGWKNLGIAVRSSDGVIAKSKTFNPSRSKTLSEAITAIVDFALGGSTAIRPIALGIERYVAYAGVHNADSEFILMVIGALVYEFELRGANVRQLRAIEWKPALCKKLYRERGFQNPSQTFDKVYSMAAAKELAPWFKGTDHEADAVCLSYTAEFIFNGKESVQTT